MLLTSAQKTSADIGLIAKCIKKLLACCALFWLSVFSSPALAGSIEELASVQITRDGMALAAELGMDPTAARDTDPTSYLGLLIRGFSILNPQKTFAENRFQISIEIIHEGTNSPTLRITHSATAEAIDFSFEPAIFATQVLFLNNCLDGTKDLARFAPQATGMTWPGIYRVLSKEIATANPTVANMVGPTVASLPGQLQGFVQSSVSALEGVVGSQLDKAASKPGLTGMAAKMCKKWWENRSKPN